MIGGSTFLVEGGGFRSIHITLQHDRTIRNPHQGAGRYGEVIAGKIQLGETGLLGEVQLFRMSDMHLMPIHREYFVRVAFCHASTPSLCTSGWMQPYRPGYSHDMQAIG